VCLPLLSHSDHWRAIFSAKVDSAWSDLLLNSLALAMNAPSRAVLLAVVIPRRCQFHALSAGPVLRCLRLRSLLVTLLALTMNLVAQAELIRGELLNDDDPYFIRAGGAVYKVQWYGGSSLFFEGDDVLLTARYGFGKMVSDATDETADVWIEQINESSANFSESVRDAITKRAVVTPAPSVPAATPAPSVLAVATPTPTPFITGPAIEAKWPDGRKLLHPDQFVRTRIVNVKAKDTLKLRSGPGTSFKVLAEIPADETEITAFNYDQVWDGDTYWCPVEWKGLRGYVGRSYLPKP
jgi:Bacterial SH3 domain